MDNFFVASCFRLVRRLTSSSISFALVLGGSVTIAIGQSAPTEHASAACPSPVELNQTTKYYFSQTADRFFFDDSYAERRVAAGLESAYSRDDIELLNTRRDSAVCQKLNERFARLKHSFVLDQERGEDVPWFYAIYFRAGRNYVSLMGPYSPGESTANRIGPPAGGYITATVYERKNLEEIGSVSF